MGVSIPNDDEFPDHAHEESHPGDEVAERVSNPEDFAEEAIDEEE